MASKYRPGKSGRRVRSWKISPNRVAWARLGVALFALMRYTEEEMRLAEDVPPEEDYEVGDTYRLAISLPNVNRSFTVNLTALTMEELEAFEKLVTLSIAVCKPIVEARDRKAAEASANGDDTLSRIYRAVPQFVIREGAFGPDGQSILNGLAYVTEGSPGGVDPDGGLRRSGAELADELSEDSQAENDWSAPH